MFKQEQLIQDQAEGVPGQNGCYYIPKCLGSILILFQADLPSFTAILPWCAVFRVRSFENNVYDLLHRVPDVTKQ